MASVFVPPDGGGSGAGLAFAAAGSAAAGAAAMLRVLSQSLDAWAWRAPSPRDSGPCTSSQPCAATTTSVNASAAGQGGLPARCFERLSLSFVSTNMRLPASISQAA